MKESSINNKIYFIENIANYSKVSKDGLNISIWCPFCRHENKSKLKLAIHLEKNFYHCWLCDKKGSDVSYIVSKLNKNKVQEAKKIFKNVTNIWVPRIKFIC